MKKHPSTHTLFCQIHTHCPCNTDTAAETMPALSLVILKFLLTYPFEFTIETWSWPPVTRPQRLCICSSFLRLNNRKQDLGIGISSQSYGECEGYCLSIHWVGNRKIMWPQPTFATEHFYIIIKKTCIPHLLLCWTRQCVNWIYENYPP